MEVLDCSAICCHLFMNQSKTASNIMFMLDLNHLDQWSSKKQLNRFGDKAFLLKRKWCFLSARDMVISIKSSWCSSRWCTVVVSKVMKSCLTYVVSGLRHGQWEFLDGETSCWKRKEILYVQALFGNRRVDDNQINSRIFTTHQSDEKIWRE